MVVGCPYCLPPLPRDHRLRNRCPNPSPGPPRQSRLKLDGRSLTVPHKSQTSRARVLWTPTWGKGCQFAWDHRMTVCKLCDQDLLSHWSANGRVKTGRCRRSSMRIIHQGAQLLRQEGPMEHAFPTLPRDGVNMTSGRRGIRQDLGSRLGKAPMWPSSRQEQDDASCSLFQPKT